MDVIEEAAFHYADGGSSDKVWAAAYDQAGNYHSAYGARGAALRSATQPCGTPQAAATIFAQKTAEKTKKGYRRLGTEEWAAFGIAHFAAAPGASAAPVAPSVQPTVAITVRAYATSHVTAATVDAIGRALVAPDWGVQEKVDGERTVIVSDEAGELSAFNRRGEPSGPVPSAALRLRALGSRFAVDGERLTRGRVGEFVAFDLLEWEGRDLRPLPYGERIALLEAALARAGLAASSPFVTAGNGPLHLLGVELREAEGMSLVDQIRSRGGEGIVARDLAGPYVVGDTRFIVKLKFESELDAIVLSVKPGKGSAGSLEMGLVRPSDGALISVGYVRSGLTDADVNKIAQHLASGLRPVLSVQYLGARTVGVHLVEPKTSLRRLRLDKSWEECTTEQFGPDKQHLVAIEPARKLPPPPAAS